MVLSVIPANVKPMNVILRSVTTKDLPSIMIQMSSKQYFVYIMSNFRRTVLYTGVTDNLVKRVWQHKNNLARGFSQRYHLHNLLYYEIFNNPTLAIEREKQIKGWVRKKKDELIIKFNPELKDLYEDINK